MSDEKDDDIVSEAQARFMRAESWEAAARVFGVDDEKFGNADSDHPEWQWPQDIFAERSSVSENAPCLVINKTRQHCLQIINDMRQHEDSVQIRPVGGGASFDAAQVFEGVVRHIEYISNASQAYDTGVWHQVFSGIGYWRVVTDFANDDSFDQEIFVRRIANPRSVYLDCDIKEYDGSDANWGIIFDTMPRDEAEALGLVDKDDAPSAPLGTTPSSWDTKETVFVAEYFRRTDKADELIELPPELAVKFGSTIRKSLLPSQIRSSIPKEWRRRKISTPEIEWFKIVGNKIKDRKTWLGKYIPIVRIIGEETVINGILDRKGHVRALKDPQRMYNYNSSASVQYGALQTKSTWLLPLEAVEGPISEYWKTANTRPPPYLPYRSSDDAGNPIPKPERLQPPAAAPAFLEGMRVAQNELMLASGQYQAVMGAPSNETSGVAINARQRQGDNATGHYLQHRATSIRFTGKILIDLIPKIYDTNRVIQIIARDGKRRAVQIDPSAKDAYQKQIDDDDDVDGNDEMAISGIFNPAIGQYDVMADVGPSFATARQEAFNAFSQIIQHNPGLVNIVGDLMFKAADFPMADEIAERLRRMVPEQATGGPSKETQALIGHVKQAAQEGQQQIEELHAELMKLKAENSARDEDMKLDWYRAETDRLKATGGIDPEALKPVIREMVSQLLGEPVVPLMHAHSQAEQMMVAPPGMPMDQPPPPMIPDGGMEGFMPDAG